MADNERIATPYFRASFVSVMQKKQQPNGEMKYSLTMCFPKNTDFTQMQALAKKAAESRWGQVPAGLVSPFKDGNEKADKYPDSHKDMIVIEARTDYKPGVVGPDKSEILDQDPPNGFYSGCWARAMVNAFAWENSGRKGVSFGLSNLQKVKDDVPFQTSYDPAEDFDAVPNQGGANTGGGAEPTAGDATVGGDWLS